MDFGSIDGQGNLILFQQKFIVSGNIIKWIVHHHVVVVLADQVTDDMPNENIWGLSLDNARILWRIPKLIHVYKDSPYINITDNDGLVQAVNWDGTILMINSKSGIIVKSSYSK